MLRELGESGVHVPNGFAVTTAAYRLQLREAKLEPAIEQELAALDVSDVAALARVARGVRHRIEHAPLPAAVREAILGAYRELGRAGGDPSAAVAVRSSATAEDLCRATSDAAS
jgi:pyruvate,water dikinase